MIEKIKSLFEEFRLNETYGSITINFAKGEPKKVDLRIVRDF